MEVAMGGFLDYLREAARAILAGGERFVLLREGRAVLEHALPGPPAVLGGGAIVARSDLLAEEPHLLEALYADPDARYLLEGDLVLGLGLRPLVLQLAAFAERSRPQVLEETRLALLPGGPARVARWKAGDDRELDAERRIAWAREALALSVSPRVRARARWGGDA